MTRAIVGCERSGIVREALRKYGVDAWSCDLEDAEDASPYHYKGDIFEVLGEHGDGLDLFIVHPECRYLSSSGLHWNGRRPERAAKTDAAIDFVRRLMVWALERKARGLRFMLENPQGCIATRLPELDAQFDRQTIQPYDYGADASKQTVLRLQNLRKLVGTQRVRGRMVEWPRGSGKMVERWSNQTDSGQNRLGPSETRWMDRARTYPPVADAMGEQWSRACHGEETEHLQVMRGNSGSAGQSFNRTGESIPVRDESDLSSA
jgi:hypothetical protein